MERKTDITTAENIFEPMALLEDSLPNVIPQTLVIPDISMMEEEIRERIELARQETKHLSSQIDKVKNKYRDSDLFQMSNRVSSINASKLNLSPTISLKGHNNKITDLSWNSDSKSILSASQDGFMIVWDAETGLKRNAIPLDSQWVLSCALSPSGKLAASAGLNNNCTIYRVSEHERVNQSIVSIFKGHTCYISDVEFYGDSNVITASGDMTCALWDIPKARRVLEYTDHLGDILALALPPERSNKTNMFATGGSDSYVHIWDTRAPSSVQKFYISNSDVNTVKFYNDGNAIVSGSDDGIIRLYDLRADCKIADYSLAKSLSDLPYPQSAFSSKSKNVTTPISSQGSTETLNSLYDAQGILDLDFSYSGRLMYACYPDVGVIAWDILKAEIIGKLEGHSNRITKIRTSPDGLAVCTGSWDTTMKIWSPNYM
ncbi:hypothetical protein TPHA_0G01840 [Tetrapisispora phaffii CBS 4417]|uniref:Uncharacterized protein n=1 Tax=Tetrapisispora phaffii (strain ATCC 24235 / CBS 4417 / NBRC 1672 / NRRL Y-8282 / UCD 70-5) TaxID=1071381 RepID=G8BVU2_TETPH|nr:hypothetical protein TPHA_0G01840 [Tetrapisispora phaffii CBS 4417]CCE64020.1 hypothetical protein TPHA_0G01840 [Tetrapisispora phaffii CBS 4417]